MRNPPPKKAQHDSNRTITHRTRYRGGINKAEQELEQARNRGIWGRGEVTNCKTDITRIDPKEQNAKILK